MADFPATQRLADCHALLTGAGLRRRKRRSP